MKKVIIGLSLILVSLLVSFIASAEEYNSFVRIYYCPFCGEQYDEDDCTVYLEYYHYKCHECGSEKILTVENLKDSVVSNKAINEEMAK